MAVTSAFPCCDCACAEDMRATTASDALQTISRPVTLCINFIVTPGFFMCRDINCRNLERFVVRCQCNFPLFGILNFPSEAGFSEVNLSIWACRSRSSDAFFKGERCLFQ